MKKLLFLLLILPFLGNSQATFTAPVGYNTGAPTATPSGVGTRWRFDLLTGKKYTWLPGSLSWDEDARGIDQVAGCSAPLYTPGYNQSTFAVNSCTVPELYQWTGAAWECLNCVDGLNLTAGAGIALSGTAPDITISSTITQSDGSETKINVGTGLSKTGSGTVGSPYVLTNSAPDQTVTMTDGTGIDVTGTYPNFTISGTAAGLSKWTDAGAYTYLTATADRVLVGSSTELNTGYVFQVSGSSINTANGVFNGQNANKMTIGASAASSDYPGVWFGPATPNLTNYAFLADVGANQSIFNAPATGNISFRIANAELMRINTTGLGVGALAPIIPTSKLDIIGANGYSQARLRTSYTPTGSADALGNTGDTAWDANYFYIKTAAGWKRTALSTF